MSFISETLVIIIKIVSHKTRLLQSVKTVEKMDGA